MRYLAFSISSICCVFYIACKGVSEKVSRSRFNKTDFIYKNHFAAKIGEDLVYNDSISIYYTTDSIVYKVPRVYTIINEYNTVSYDRKYDYFIRKRGNRFGIALLHKLDKKFIQIDLDSVIQKELYANVPFFDLSRDKLVHRSVDGQIEKYRPVYSKLEDIQDTATFYFSEYKNNIHTFSKILEKIKNKKIYKVELMYLNKHKKFSSLYGKKFSFELKNKTPSFGEDSIVNSLLRRVKML
jgi:hypothetical protein